MFDTTYAINGWAWFLIWLLLPSTSNNKGNDSEK